MDRQPNNNLWAEKLLQVSMPDSGEAWAGMEGLLDRELPQRFRSDRRRWLLLILLLLLLIGVCNCPGSGRLFHNSGHGSGTMTSHPAGATGARMAVPAGPAVPAAAAVIPGSANHRSRMRKAPASHHRLRPATAPVAFGDITQTATGDTAATGGNDTPGSNTARDTAAKRNAPALPKAAPRKDSLRKDSVHKKPPPPPEEPKKKDHGWVFGIGLNQFFPLGDQRGSIYNSNGLTGTLSDYLPVPMIRYYLNQKAYLQVEAQLNTPQPTAKNLVISQPVPDSTSTNGVFTQVTTSASIQQLYYFNIPLSIHFNPWDNLDIGTGLQWSHLSNAVGEFDSSTSTSVNGSGPNVVDAKTTHSFKGDTLYQRIKTNELRFLFDANYTHKHWVLGLRYNQALSKFVNLQLPTGGTTQARNSSFQLYLRYILWDTRKKKKQGPP